MEKETEGSGFSQLRTDVIAMSHDISKPRFLLQWLDCLGLDDVIR